MKRGILVHCSLCGLMKKPRGRSEPLGVEYCTSHTCCAYWDDPKPGDLWPGETDAEFGYPCGDDATEPVAPGKDQ